MLYLAIFAAGVALAQNEGELAEVKEFELEEVRERISELKQSMDRRAAERDRLSVDLQDAELKIAEKRIGLKEIERGALPALEALSSGDPGVERLERRLQRRFLSDRAAAIRVVDMHAVVRVS